MKKIITLFIATSIFSANVQAELVSVEKARAKALAFFEADHQTRSAVGISLELVYPAATRAAGEVPSYYIFNRTDRDGFVFVSAESETREILAYSNESRFSMDNENTVVHEFMDYYTSSIEAVRSGKSAFMNVASEDSIEGKLLETANFNQENDYFNERYAPVDKNGRKCYSGCTATASCIVMDYYKWPNQCTGYNKYHCNNLDQDFECDFSSIQFDWDLIDQSEIDSLASDEISKLQKVMGIAINAEYSSTGTSAYTHAPAYALRKFFHYEQSTYTTIDSYSNEELNSILKREIDEDRPLIATGFNQHGYGHSFVIDGYDENGLYHCNIGWGGLDNAYYSIDLVDNKYAIKNMVIGIKPAPMDKDLDFLPLFIDNIDIIPDGNINSGCIFDIVINRLLNFSNDIVEDLFVRADVHDSTGLYKCTVHNGISVSKINAGYNYTRTLSGAMIPDSCMIDASDYIVICASKDSMETWQPIIYDFYYKPKCTLGYHETDVPVISQLRMNDEPSLIVGDNDSLGYTKVIVHLGKILNKSYLYYSGKIGVGIIDTTDMSLKYVLATNDIKLKPNYYYSTYKINNVCLNDTMDLNEHMALVVISKSNDSDNYRFVYDSNWNLYYRMLSDLTDIDLADVPQIQDLSKAVRITTLDGKAAGSVSNKGIYLITYPDGKTVKAVFP